MKKLIGIVLLAGLVALGCDDKKSGGGGSGGGETAAVEIAKLGLKVDAPSGSRVSDAPIGGGVMIQGPGLTFTVEVAGEDKPETAEAAKEDADMYSPKNLKTEKLADGWALTFENKGSMGSNYFLKARRTIGGKAYWCETTTPEADQRDAALAACKSLKK